MAPISPGVDAVRSRRPKKAATSSTNLHRFESFTARIARLKIDPVHTVEKRRPLSSDVDLSQSHFRAALDEWAELNLCRTFTSFLRGVNPLCESLPQLLHHADTIVALLVEHIAKRDALALEPLLALVAHLAHDLGSRFEDYFAQIVELVAAVAAAHDSADVIEWCFTCLAWLFKYLARLLVQDLRPLLTIMSPYLAAKKHYVVRFSAESLAFLLRKAAVLYPKRPEPLKVALEHLVHALVADLDLASSASLKTGIVTLCVESAGGVDGGLHSSAGSLTRCLLDTISAIDPPHQARATAEGCVVALIHQSNPSGFEPVLEAVLDHAHRCAASHQAPQKLLALRLLTVLVGTRRGARIVQWPNVLRSLLDIISPSTESGETDDPIRQEVVAVCAAVLQYTPLKHLLPCCTTILDALETQLSPRQYFAFCALCADLGRERFADLVFPRLQKFIVQHWSADEVSMYYFLETQAQPPSDRESRPAARNVMAGLQSPPLLQSLVVETLSKAPSEIDAGNEECLCGRTRVPNHLRLSLDQIQRERLLAASQRLLESALQEGEGKLGLLQRVRLGWGLSAQLHNLSDDDPRLEQLAALVLDTAPVKLRLPAFLTNILQLLQRLRHIPPVPEGTLERFRSSLVENLLSESQALKAESLRLLAHLAPAESGDATAETVSLLLEILDIPYTPRDARKIAALLKRLPVQQNKFDAQSSVSNLIPFFGLGMLFHYHDQTREELCHALAQMSSGPATEESIINIAVQWLQMPPVATDGSYQVDHQTRAKPSFFECYNLSHLDARSADILGDFQHAESRFRSLTDDAHRLETRTSPSNARTVALQVLLAMPAAAERRSRLLAPMFLGAPMTRGQMQHKPSSDSSTSSHTLSAEVDDHEWSLPDRKALLTLVGKFVNPRVLFKSAQIYEKLVDLVGNGNSAVRKLALQAVLAWKDPSLTAYATTLLQIAEEKIPTTDLATLLHAEDGQSGLKAEDRPVTLPILLRLVFGMIVGRTGTDGPQEARRKSILRTLFRMHEKEVSLFLDIALGPLKNLKLDGRVSELVGINQVIPPEDQQYGFLRLLHSMLEILQGQFDSHGPQVVDAVVYCVVRASPPVDADGKVAPPPTSLARSIRRTGTQCLVALFQHSSSIQWSLYLPTIFANLISPRLESFPSETNQGISGLLRLFSSWAHSDALVGFLWEYDDRVPGTLWKTLASPAAAKEVKVFILGEVVLPWINLADDDSLLPPNSVRDALQVETDNLLNAIVVLLERHPPKEILNAIATILPRLAPFAKSEPARRSAMHLLASLLSDSKHRLPPKIKSQLLLSIHRFLEVSAGATEESVQTEVLALVSSLFNYFNDQPNRQTLCSVLETLSQADDRLAQVAQLCQDMNAVATDRLDEIDYDRRLAAFHRVNAAPLDEDLGRFWSPIVHNLIFFVRTADDLSIRSNALACLRSFIVRACEARVSGWEEFMKLSILPTVKKCLRHESEVVRSDFVALYGLLVQHAEAPELEDMRVLLVDNDDEASFFTNILHIQQHRRLRAIRRLLHEVERGAISAHNVAQVFIPLLEMFIGDVGTDESNQSAKGSSMAAMSTLLQWVDWKDFKPLFRRYKQELGANPGSQKASGRLFGHAADALLSLRPFLSGPDAVDEAALVPHLSRSINDLDVVQTELRQQFLPKLAELVHYKDEAEISFRIPVAVTAIKLITLLPQDEISTLAAPILLDVAQILRSRTQESRNVARNTLCQMALLLGPWSVQFVLKEMRTALTQGYQLHVLSYTLHAILVAISPSLTPGDLDHCVDELVLVVMDDIFGTVGQQKANEDYVSSMKEVKSSKSNDSMELLARTIGITSLSRLMAPIQVLLTGTLTTKQSRQVDELLRRIGAGVTQNPMAQKRDVLVFAYQTIEAFYRQKSVAAAPMPTLDRAETRARRYLVQVNSAHKATNGQTSPSLFKLARFALDLVRSTLQRHGDLMTTENVHGFLPIIGDALIEGQEDVQVSALRLLSAIIKLPLPELDQNAPIYLMEAAKVVKNATNTNEEAAQAALKLFAAVLRERKSVAVRDSDVAELLGRIAPDIEEPDRQGVTFNFIRAVMSRKMQLPQLYDVVDKIGIMMVTNQTKAARDVARGVYVHFLLDYPQTAARWSKQQKFLVKNLEYDHAEGRTSVMEAINTLLVRVTGPPAQQLLSTFFAPVLLRMANDDNKGSRETAGALLGQIARLADRQSLTEILEPLRSWRDQDEIPALQAISLQVYRILLDVGVALGPDELDELRDALETTLEQVSRTGEAEWELFFQCLLLMGQMTDAHPATVLTQRQVSLWQHVWQALGHRHPWIQSTAATLMAQVFQHCGSPEKTRMPLVCDHGLQLERADLLTVLRSSVRVLKRSDASDELRAQTVENLTVLGLCLDVNGVMMEVADRSGDEDAPDDASDSDSRPRRTMTIPAIQYLLDQLTRIVRVETTSLTSPALLPKQSSLALFLTLIPRLSPSRLSERQVHDLLIPLQHLTDPHTVTPRSAEPTFAATGQALTELAHEVMETLRRQLGDVAYVQAVTAASKTARVRREERRAKRRIEHVADPAKAARDKKRKADRKKERKKEMGQSHRRRRLEM